MGGSGGIFTIIKIPESKENKSIHRLNLSGSTGPGGGGACSVKVPKNKKNGRQPTLKAALTARQKLHKKLQTDARWNSAVKRSYRLSLMIL